MTCIKVPWALHRDNTIGLSESSRITFYIHFKYCKNACMVLGHKAGTKVFRQMPDFRPSHPDFQKIIACDFYLQALYEEGAYNHY